MYDWEASFFYRIPLGYKHPQVFGLDLGDYLRLKPSTGTTPRLIWP
jgi:hypothetical protein